MDTTGETMATLSHTMNELIRLDTKIADSQARSDAKLRDLAETQTPTDLLNSLLDIVERNERKVN